MEQRISFYRGCLLGLAIGDALGYPIDGKSWEEISESYGPAGLLGFDLQHDYAEVTSYTQLAAYTLNGLLAGYTRGRREPWGRYVTAAIREWAKGQQYRGFSDKTFCWVSQVPALRRRTCMDTRMLDTLSRQTLGTPENPVNSYAAPGGLTAAAAAGLFFSPERMSPQEVGRLAIDTAAMLQGDPEAFLSGAVAAYALAGILQEPEHTLAQQFLQAAEAVRGQFGESWPEAAAAVEAQVKKAIHMVKRTEQPSREVMELLKCTTAAECLAGAVYACLIHPGNFDEAVTVAVNHSGRSSAVGALVGAFMGAKLGAEGLPEFYVESLETVQPLSVLSEDLVLGRQAVRIFDDSWDQKYIQGLFS